MLDHLIPANTSIGAVAVSVAFALVFAWVLGVLAARATRTLLDAVSRGADRGEAGANDARRVVRIAGWTVFLATAATMVVPAVRLSGMDVRVGLSPERLAAWLLASGVRIGGIALVAYILVRLIAGVSRRLETHIGRAGGIDHVRRGRTLSRLAQSTMTTIVVVLAGLTILRELNVDITPILTGAGIVGLAVGFGGQTLVRDLISGFFLIIEDQIRVGDTAAINGVSGVVEAINLRTVALRDGEGALHIFPNGGIDRLANRSRDYSVYVTDVEVASKHTPEEVIQVLRAVGEQLRTDRSIRDLMIEPMQVLGVEAMRPGQMTVRVSVKTVPQKHAEVGRELLRVAKRELDAHGIAAPVPTMALQMGEASRPLLVRQDGSQAD
jgi:small conductance mechanosensitive channel